MGRKPLQRRSPRGEASPARGSLGEVAAGGMPFQCGLTRPGASVYRSTFLPLARPMGAATALAPQCADDARGRQMRGQLRRAHGKTSVAWDKTDGGIVNPMSWAVLRLMTSSNAVGASTGRSPGLAPSRI